MTTTPNTNKNMPPISLKMIVETGHLIPTSNHGRRNKTQHNTRRSTSRLLLKLTVQLNPQGIFREICHGHQLKAPVLHRKILRLTYLPDHQLVIIVMFLLRRLSISMLHCHHNPTIDRRACLHRYIIPVPLM
jgi:hypothetical protein